MKKTLEKYPQSSKVKPWKTVEDTKETFGAMFEVILGILEFLKV